MLSVNDGVHQYALGAGDASGCECCTGTLPALLPATCFYLSPLTSPHALPCLSHQVYGITPFRGARRDETFDNVVKAPLRFPVKPSVSPECQALISLVRAKDRGGGCRRGRQRLSFIWVSCGLCQASRPAPIWWPEPQLGLIWEPGLGIVQQRRKGKNCFRLVSA